MLLDYYIVIALGLMTSSSAQVLIGPARIDVEWQSVRAITSLPWWSPYSCVMRDIDSHVSEFGD